VLKYCIIEKGNEYNMHMSSTGQPHQIENCIFRNAVGRGVYFYNSGSPEIVDCQVQNNGGQGIYAEGTSLEMENVQIENNGGYGLYYNSAYYVTTLENVTLSGNELDGVVIAGGNISTNRLWNAYTYFILGNISVYVGGRDYTGPQCRLTLSPGTTLKFAQGTNMQISNYTSSSYYYRYYGELNAIGTAEAPIVFTSMNGQSGGWNGLYFHDYSDNLSGQESVLKYCIIEKGNEYNMHMSSTGQPHQIENCIFRDAVGNGVYLYYGGTSALQHCKILNNGNYGLRLYGGSPSIKNTTIKDNASYGLYLEGNSNPTVGGNFTNGCDIYRNNGGNGGYEVYHNGSANISMPYNFFGSIDSVYIDQQLIYDKKEDNNKGRINVKPNSYLPINAEPFGWSGHLYYNGNTSKPMPNQTLVIKDYQGNPLREVTTGSNGNFGFGDLTLGVATKIDLESPNITGINATDALLAMRHYTQLQALEGAQLRAADVNLSNTVNGTDALLIQLRGICLPPQTCTLPAGDVQFTSEGFEYSGENMINDLNVLWFGDIDGGSNSWRGGVTLQYEGNLVAESHQQLSIPVVVKNACALGAVTLHFSYPEDLLGINGVTINGSNANMMYQAADGVLSVSWYDLAPLILEGDELMLSIDVTTGDLSQIDEPVLFSLDGNCELADGNGQVIDDAVIAMPMVVTETLGLNDMTNGAFSLTVYPNPVEGKAVMAYELPAEGHVTLTVFNAMGQQMTQVVDERQAAGVHQVEIGSDIWAAGVYYCRLTYGDTVKVIKMVVE
jgi:parallel beta-helix repeat protein